ncbi:MAG: sulfatase-like hydrolase/transferase [candidate division Zixibacteria bacterium]|nr:sulfatase-like hydrolase/transferase [candidate division Zixibacteria bacterium]
MKKHRTILVSAIAIVYVLLLSCGQPAPKPNIILIIIDTLRADHLGYNGYQRNTSPNIDAFAQEGVVFNNAYSQSGWTLPSIATIFTSLHPREHGAIEWSVKLDTGLTTIAEVLRDNGYYTYGYPALFALNEESGFQQGFNTYPLDIPRMGKPQYTKSSPKVNELIINDLGNIQEPFFIWGHYYDPHSVYMTHDNFIFGDGKKAVDRYDGEIAYVDYFVGMLFKKLQKMQLYENSVIIVMSDHGEEFFDHGRESHYTLYEEVLKIPLIIKAPGEEHREVDKYVSQIDIAPTIINFAGIDSPEQFTGIDIMDDDIPNRPVFAERGDKLIAFQRAVIDDGMKLYHIDIGQADTSNPRFKKQEFYRNEKMLFALTRDPAEKTNIYGIPDFTDIRNKLDDRFYNFYQGEAKPLDVIEQLDEETVEKLRQLGYIE